MLPIGRGVDDKVVADVSGENKVCATAAILFIELSLQSLRLTICDFGFFAPKALERLPVRRYWPVFAGLRPGDHGFPKVDARDIYVQVLTV